jgi:hypothetical protein
MKECFLEFSITRFLHMELEDDRVNFWSWIEALTADIAYDFDIFARELHSE